VINFQVYLWDPGVHLASRISDYMMIQVAPEESHTPPWVGFGVGLQVLVLWGETFSSV
jgi:hypothetical protein